MRDHNRLLRSLHHLLCWRRSAHQAFPPQGLRDIENLITTGEQQHGAQVRFVVEHAVDQEAIWSGMTPRQRAQYLFAHLRVWDTEANLGILIYVNLADHQVEILADRGVHQLVQASVWHHLCQQMTQGFRQGHYIEPSLQVLKELNALLAERLPRNINTTNELPDKPLML